MHTEKIYQEVGCLFDPHVLQEYWSHLHRKHQKAFFSFFSKFTDLKSFSSSKWKKRKEFIHVMGDNFFTVCIHATTTTLSQTATLIRKAFKSIWAYLESNSDLAPNEENSFFKMSLLLKNT